MRIIDRYIATTLLKMTGMALLAFLVLFTFLSLIDQLEDSGRGNYDAIKAFQYVLLTTPRIAYELIPVAAIIGSITTLGLMSYNSELVIIRASGMSLAKLAWAMFKGGLLIIVFAVLLGELVAPYCEQAAQELRSVAMSEQIALKTRNGFWSRGGRSFINIRTLLPGNKLEDIYIYEFDENDRLRIATHAGSASYRNNQWLLQDIQQSVIEEDGITRNKIELAAWDSLLNPDMLNLVTVKPQYLTVKGLVYYISYLKKNEQNSDEYEHALWKKLVMPVTVTVMILLAVPLVKTYSRSVSVSQRIFIGCFIGIVFHITNEVSGQMGVVYSINAIVSATLPTVLVGAATFYLILRNP